MALQASGLSGTLQDALSEASSSFPTEDMVMRVLHCDVCVIAHDNYVIKGAEAQKGQAVPVKPSGMMGSEMK